MKVRIAAALAVASIIPALGAASAQAASSGMYSCPSFHAVHVSAGPYSAQFITHITTNVSCAVADEIGNGFAGADGQGGVLSEGLSQGGPMLIGGQWWEEEFLSDAQANPAPDTAGLEFLTLSQAAVEDQECFNVPIELCPGLTGGVIQLDVYSQVVGPVPRGTRVPKAHSCPGAWRDRTPYSTVVRLEGVQTNVPCSVAVKVIDADTNTRWDATERIGGMWWEIGGLQGWEALRGSLYQIDALSSNAAYGVHYTGRFVQYRSSVHSPES